MRNVHAMHVVRLFGFRFSGAKHLAMIADAIMEDAAGAAGVAYLITPNASTIVYYNERRHHALKSFYADCRYILPDGMPIVWLSRLKSGQRLYRLPGSDLFPELWQRIRATQLSAVFVVANDMLAQRLNAEHTGCRFIVPGMFAADDDMYIAALAADVVLAVREVKARFVFLGLNFPKQEKLGIGISAQLPDHPEHPVLLLLLGASFEFYFSLKPRAPQWVQRNGLEWLHRFTQEPARLWKRYTIDNLRFLMLALKELFLGND